MQLFNVYGNFFRPISYCLYFIFSFFKFLFLFLISLYWKTWCICYIVYSLFFFRQVYYVVCIRATLHLHIPSIHTYIHTYIHFSHRKLPNRKTNPPIHTNRERRAKKNPKKTLGHPCLVGVGFEWVGVGGLFVWKAFCKIYLLTKL